MSWIFSVVEIYLMLGFIIIWMYSLSLMTWLYYWSVCDISLWCFMLICSMHV